MAYFVYMLRCGDGSLYTGSTNDVERRLKALHVSIVRDRAVRLDIADGAVTGVTGEREKTPAPERANGH